MSPPHTDDRHCVMIWSIKSLSQFCCGWTWLHITSSFTLKTSPSFLNPRVLLHLSSPSGFTSLLLSLHSPLSSLSCFPFTFTLAVLVCPCHWCVTLSSSSSSSSSLPPQHNPASLLSTLKTHERTSARERERDHIFNVRGGKDWRQNPLEEQKEAEILHHSFCRTELINESSNCLLM